MMSDCDTLLMVGSGFPVFGVPAEGGPGARRADRHRRRACSSLRYPMEVNLVGDSATTLARAAAAAASRRRIARGATKIESERRDWWETLARARDASDANPINPQRVFWELSPRLPDDAMLACDTGIAVHWYARDLKMRRGMRAVALGQPRHRWGRAAVRDRGEVRLPRAPGARASSATARCR